MTGHVGEFEQLILLALLRLGSSAYGVTVRREIHERTGRDVSQGAVYTVLNRLSEKGLVRWRVAESAPERGGRRRKYYELRPEGARVLQRSLADLRLMAKGLSPKLTELAEKAS